MLVRVFACVYSGVCLGAWMCAEFVGGFAGVCCGNFAAIRARGGFWDDYRALFGM